MLLNIEALYLLKKLHVTLIFWKRSNWGHECPLLNSRQFCAPSLRPSSRRWISIEHDYLILGHKIRAIRELVLIVQGLFVGRVIEQSDSSILDLVLEVRQTLYNLLTLFT